MQKHSLMSDAQVLGDSPVTGRYFLAFPRDLQASGTRFLATTAGLKVARTDDFDSAALRVEELGDAEALVYHNLGVALVSVDPDQLQWLSTAQPLGFPKFCPESERIISLINPIQMQFDPDTLTTAEVAAPETWGLRVTRAVHSTKSGQQVKVAILDSGFDLTHPDFTNRNIAGNAHSFVPGQTVQDSIGHGTHCTGTACGPLHPGRHPRYGIAHNAEIYIGKIIDDAGKGTDCWLLAGINWAIEHRCQIVSMSLGTLIKKETSFSSIFETAASRALQAGTLLIAAAGNDSRRSSDIFNPVSHPANCPSIMAVASVDTQLRVALNSNQEFNSDGGQVDIAAPGVSIYSSWLEPARYLSRNGTSMATPHVAGIAALHLEANPNIVGLGLWARLMQTAQRLPLSSKDVGSGLVQAP